MDGIKFLIENRPIWHSDLLNSIYHFMDFIIKLNLPVSGLEACFTIACIGIRLPYEPIQNKSLNLLIEMIHVRTELSSGIGEALFLKVVDMMQHKNSETHSSALRFVASCLSGENTRLVDIAIENGFFENLYILLSSSSTELVTETLWAISNITASSPTHASAFLD